MDYTNNYEARDIIVEIMKKDLLGPVYDDEIICNERPVNYYLLGKLYPQDCIADITGGTSSEDCNMFDSIDSIVLNNSNNPSSFGLSFSIDSNTECFNISLECARYIPISKENAKEKIGFEESEYDEKAVFWQREQLTLDDIIVNTSDLESGDSKRFEIAEKLSIRVLQHKVYSDGTKTISVSMINEYTSDSSFKGDSEKAFFQPKITIFLDSKYSFLDVRNNIHLNKNEELAELEMLYSENKIYASGHGCAVNWTLSDNGTVNSIYTDFLPSYELLQMMPSHSFSGKILQMNYLASSGYEDVKEGLLELVDEYSEWIKNQKKLMQDIPSEYKESAEINIGKCEKTCNVIKKSVSELSDPIVFKAFSLANKAMFLQRKKMLENKNEYVSDDSIKWYPFQLAFFLQEVVSFSDPRCEERKNVDLLWFPTGGGKTEAYLGISAFVIFLRRLRNPNNCDGVTILMRYTLRLLTYQQFERASALICACEIIRREENIPGGEISIGLWAGQALTPNYLSDANDVLKGKILKDYPYSTPVQLLKCPWCKKEMDSNNYKYDATQNRIKISCGDENCDFHDSLPTYVVDEELYVHRPTFVISTIDKFAQIALNQNTFSLFGKNTNDLPPELIIQDELHLISGPLGTITGLYEAAVTKLCEHEDINVKIVASTATIRNAEEQIKSLYVPPFTQFPPQGISIKDSFFAVESSRLEKLSRLYLGTMATGTSNTTQMIRVMADLLYGSRYLAEKGYDDELVDSFWTITGYYTSLRELGGAIIRVLDDVQSRFNYLKNAKFIKLYTINNPADNYSNYIELTSRVKSEDISKIIECDLEEKYTSDLTTHPIDFLLSSNMLSVGVDVGRLGSMVVVGQPKTTSEYIQSTSRVGRKYPGLVVTTFNQSRTRDRSHYEDFTQYHNSFYRFVEATSVTPFSDRARARALQTLFVILCRNEIPELFNDNSAINFSSVAPERLKPIEDYIISRVELIDSKEKDNVIKELKEIKQEWTCRCEHKENMTYRNTGYNSLFDSDYDEESRFRVMNSMRSVEQTINVSTNDD